MSTESAAAEETGAAARTRDAATDHAEAARPETPGRAPEEPPGDAETPSAPADAPARHTDEPSNGPAAGAETAGDAAAGEAGGEVREGPSGAEAGPPADGTAAGGDTSGDAAAAERAEGGAASGDGTGGQGGEDPSPAEADRPADEPAAGGEISGGAVAGGGGDGGEAGGDGGGLSEAEVELAAQRELRERIAQRKAEKQGPVESGAKLSGPAADLLAAVRAVESGAKPVAAVFQKPLTEPRSAASESASPGSASPASRDSVRAAAPDPARAGRPGGVGTAASQEMRPAAEAVEAVAAVLGEYGAPAALAERAAAVLGDGAAGQLRDDPWLLLRIAGVRPEQADGFARALLGEACGPDDARRGRAVAVWLLEQAALAGHTVLDAPALRTALGQRGVPDPDAAVQSAIAEGDVLVFQDAVEDAPAPAPAAPGEEGEERPVRVRVGLERCALAEESLADGLARIVNSLAKEDGSEQARWESAGTARSSAAELLRAAASHGLVLHTGGEAARAEPAALVAAARELGLRVCAAAHSTDGRDRFARLLPAGGAEEIAGAEAEADVTTVSGLLSGAEGPGRDAEGALALDLLVVLDTPQLDVETAAMLVESLPDGARLVLSGDPGVLWSAGAGRVFADLLAARVCPQIVSRTPDPGPLGELVSGIGVGELNQVAAPDKEVVIVPVRDAGEAVHRTVQLVADSVPRAVGVPAEHTQVITLGHGGAAGTRVLNAALKERLNPGPGRFGGFDPGDRVVHTPVPGRIAPGRVVRADTEGLHLDCAGTPVVVPKERVGRTVRHGWALTAHQAVGWRWPAAVVVLPGDEVRALTRAWVYTAFGRAERHLSVVHGVDQALVRAVAEVSAKERTTRLRTLLRAQIPSTTA
ncbi:helix-hairpin-helix domain-containing protein [Streptomyces sp. O3]